MGLTWTTLIASSILVGAADPPDVEPAASAADAELFVPELPHTSEPVPAPVPVPVPGPGALELRFENISPALFSSEAAGAPGAPGAPEPESASPGLPGAQGTPGPDQTETQPARKPYGVMDSWRFNIQGAYDLGIHDTEDVFGLGGVGLSYFCVDHLSLEMELNAMYFNQDEGPDAWGGNFALLMRWHFMWKQNWSLYIDGGAGVLLTTEDVPPAGSSFNFTPQAGLGLSVAITDEVRLLTGVRWHHISNANIYSSNPGRDSIEIYAGLSLPF